MNERTECEKAIKTLCLEGWYNKKDNGTRKLDIYFSHKRIISNGKLS